MPVRIEVNGEPRTMEAVCSISELLQELKINPASVAVEKNMEIVRREDFEQIVLKDKDAVELIRFVGGG
ncbi:MAG: sulfur carrier protein ThiS [Desulfohalobiaceae bacterium]|nr:sulfur carrier protein ThiS [Desulfohalobiaceae bacterium]